MNKFTLKDLPEEERPRERLMRLGPHALGSAELLAVVLGSGTRGKSVLHLAQELLCFFGSLHAIGSATIAELCRIRGLGQAKAIQLKAALCLAGRLEEPYEDRLPATTPQRAYDLVKKMFLEEKRELFGVLLQNAKGKMIRCEVISIGTLTQTLVHPREVFYPAIRYQAASLILVHNHPSGDVTPSSEDIQVTQLLIEVGHMMNIPVQDHLIVSSFGFFSLREKNLCKFLSPSH